MNDKTTGYALLSIGIIVMFISLASMFLVFTNTTKPIEFYTISKTAPKPPVNTNDLINTIQSGGQPDLTSLLSSNINFIPPETLNQSLNLTIHLFLMGFLMSFGYKIANLGVMLIRPVYVKMKVKEESITPVKA